MNTEICMPAQRHGFWKLWIHHITSHYVPAKMNDFGRLVPLNVERACYSLSLEFQHDPQHP